MPMLLRSLRTSAGLTQFDLAVKAGVTEATIRRIEAGRHGPHLGTRERIAEALRVSVEQIDWPERVRSTVRNDIRGAAPIGVRSGSPDHEGE